MTAKTLNTVEHSLQEIWCDVLDINEVDKDDNFFDLGGHSLLLGLVQDKINQEICFELSLMDLFANPTIQTLSAFILEKNKECHRERSNASQ